MGAVMEAPPKTLAADAESREWLAALRGEGTQIVEATARLHDLLLRAARFEVSRRAGTLGHLREHLDDIAQQSADDALVALLGKLDTFRGDSRFTTWAYKFALLETAVSLRRRAWQGREITLGDESWRNALADTATPAHATETAELLDAVREGIVAALSPHQREVLVAVTLDGVPIDVLAERTGSTRGALYKTLHDARRKLRGHLTARGLDLAAVDAEESR